MLDEEVRTYSLHEYNFIGIKLSTRGSCVAVYVSDGSAETVERRYEAIACTKYLILEGRFGMFGSHIYLSMNYRQPSKDTSASLHNLEWHAIAKKNYNHIILG